MLKPKFKKNIKFNCNYLLPKGGNGDGISSGFITGGGNSGSGGIGNFICLFDNCIGMGTPKIIFLSGIGGISGGGLNNHIKLKKKAKLLIKRRSNKLLIKLPVALGRQWWWRHQRRQHQQQH